MKRKKLLCLLLCLGMAASLLPAAALADNTATMKYINVTGTDNAGNPEYELSESKGVDTISVCTSTVPTARRPIR